MKKFLIIISFIFTLVPSFIQAETVSVSSIHELVNKERTKIGLPTLLWNPILTKAAENKAQDLVNKGYFDHTSPDGTKFYEWISNAGYSFITAGENLAVNTNTMSNTAIVEAWMNSPLHKENILASKYQETGIALTYGTYEGQQAVFVVQVFAAPQSSSQQSTVGTSPSQGSLSGTGVGDESVVAKTQKTVSKSVFQVVNTAVSSNVQSELATSSKSEPTGSMNDAAATHKDLSSSNSFFQKLLYWFSSILGVFGLSPDLSSLS